MPLIVRSGSDHAGARRVLEAVRPGERAAWYQAVQAVAHAESQYGYGFKRGREHDPPLWNWGAISGRGPVSPYFATREAAERAASSHECPDGNFPGVDSNARGWYVGCLAGYPDHEGAAGRLIGVLRSGPMRGRFYPIRPVQAADVSLDALARAMWATGYYVGQPQGTAGALVPAKVASYRAFLARSSRAIAAALGEPPIAELGAPALSWAQDAAGNVDPAGELRGELAASAGGGGSDAKAGAVVVALLAVLGVGAALLRRGRR